MTTALLIECTLKAAALLMIAWIGSLALRKASAAARHMAWVAALVAVLVLPAVIALAPAWQALPQTRIIVDAAAGASLPAQGSMFSLLNLWMLGAGLTFAVFAMAHVRTAALVLRSRKEVEMRTTRESVSPFVWGFFNPVVIWPEQANEWPDALRRSVLMHEREHARRFDFLWLIVAQFACSVYWFLPLAWFAARQAREESERACDDAVLREGTSSTEYAEQLLHVARTTMASGAVPAMTGGSSMERRMRALLDRTANRGSLSRRILITATLAAVAILVPLAALQTARAADDDTVHKIGGDILSPRLVHKVEPQYTEEARDAKIAGTVKLSVIIERDGVANDIKVIESLDPGLDANAILAVKQWDFEPATKDGKPVRVSATIEVNFKLL
ncbi:MAG: M56 family metallopeptidase [Acidobacteriota bacterium]